MFDKILLTEYAGHFAAGMLLYQIKKGEKGSFTILGLLLSGLLIWHHCSGFESWINGMYHQGLSELGTFMIAPISIALVYWVSEIKFVPISSEISLILGSMSYTLYLLHADLGFFERAMTHRWLFVKFPELQYWVNETLIVLVAIISSLLLSAIVALCLEPPLKKVLKKFSVPNLVVWA